MQSTVNLVNVEKYKDRIFLSLSIGRWGNRAKVTDPEALAEFLRLLALEKKQAKAEKDGVAIAPEDNGESNGNGASKSLGIDAVTSSKRLINPKAEALKAITDHLNEVKDSIIGKYKGIAQPSQFLKGVYTLRKDRADEVNRIVEAGMAKLNDELIPAFVDAFPAMQEAAQTAKLMQGGLGPLYSASDYPDPSTAASKFKVQDQYLELGVSDKISEELRAKKSAEFEAKVSNALEKSMEALRLGFAELVDHAVEKLTVAPGDKPKIFKASLVSNFVDFCRSFKDKDFGDEALAELVSKAEAIIAPGGQPLDPDRLRKFANVRDGVQNGFAAIQQSLDGMITERKGRKIDLSEED